MDSDGASSIFLLSFSIFMYNFLQDHKEPMLRCLMEKILKMDEKDRLSRIASFTP